MEIVFFIYGLSFFILGSAIYIYPKKETPFEFSGALNLIAAFGIMHGINEWIDMFLLRYAVKPVFLQYVRLLILPVSFFFLVQFGTKIIMLSKKSLSLVRFLPVFLLLLWAGVTPFSRDMFLSGDIWARYLLGIPGIFLTVFAFFLISKRFEALKMYRVSRYLKLVAGGFFFYGVFSGLVVPAGHFFPASVINYKAFINIFHMPVQAFRTVCAAVAAFGVVRFLGIFEAQFNLAVKNTKETLETMVSERTAKLNEANEHLTQEILAKEQAEKELLLSEEKYRNTINYLSSAIHVIDRDFRIVLMNSLFKEWNRELGIEADIEGQNIFEAFPFLGKRVREQYEIVFETGEILIT